MAIPPDDSPKRADLPDPELNPLMNPTLGKNLGRWAQVYFTSPPETRTQAVEELLRELNGEENKVNVSNDEEGKPLTNRDSAGNDVLLCPRCHESNSPQQKFCGVCGSPLDAVSQHVPLRDATGTHHQPAPFESSQSTRGEDIDWLRDRSLGLESEPEGPSRKTWAFAAVALVLVLGGAAYLQFAPHPASPPSATPDSATSSPIPEKESGPPPASLPANPPAPKESEPVAKTGQDAKTASKPPAGSAEQASPEASSGASDPSTAEDNGAHELAEAQRLLARNPEVAARLLWKSVGKKNSGAELALADLYSRGEGVGKNCEQARLLLVAAAKQGVGEAAQKLRNLESNGCR